MRSLRLILPAVLLGFGALWWFLWPATPPAAEDVARQQLASETVEAVETVEAAPAERIAGRVFYPDGSPVGPGFEVAAFLDGIEPPVPAASAITDADGAFVLPASLIQGPPFVLDAVGNGWGTDRRTLSAAVQQSGRALDLTVQPLYGALLQARTEASNGARAEFLGSAELRVPRTLARQIRNLSFQHGHGEPGWELLLYTPTNAGEIPDVLHGELVCRRLDGPAPMGRPLLVPRWSRDRVVRLDSTPCWSSGPLTPLEVSISGGFGSELLAPDHIFATLELQSEAGQTLLAPISVAEWRAGVAKFQVPHGTYTWSLIGSVRNRATLAAGTVEILHGAAEIDVDFNGLGAFVLEVQEADGTAFTGPLRAELMRILQESSRSMPDGRETRDLNGTIEVQEWPGPPYVALLLQPGEYLARIPEMVVTYAAGEAYVSPPGERANLAAGELVAVRLHRRAPTD